MVENPKRRGYDKYLKRSWVDQFYTEINLVQQRFNYFLLATSFLFLAFVTLITGKFFCLGCAVQIIVHVTALAGVLLSLYFFQINYHQAKVAAIIRQEEYCKPLPPDYEHPAKWSWDAWWDGIKYPCLAMKFGKSRPVSYTWAVPFAFFCFWIVVWGIWSYCIGCNFRAFLVLLIPIGFCLYFWCKFRKSVKQPMNPRNVLQEVRKLKSQPEEAEQDEKLDEVALYGRVTELKLHKKCFELKCCTRLNNVSVKVLCDGGRRRAVSMKGINEGDMVIVIGELKKEDGTDYSKGDFWAKEIII